MTLMQEEANNLPRALEAIESENIRVPNSTSTASLKDHDDLVFVPGPGN
jgi:hypothetical protein